MSPPPVSLLITSSLPLQLPLSIVRHVLWLDGVTCLLRTVLLRRPSTLVPSVLCLPLIHLLRSVPSALCLPISVLHRFVPSLREESACIMLLLAVYEVKDGSPPNLLHTTPFAPNARPFSWVRNVVQILRGALVLIPLLTLQTLLTNFTLSVLPVAT